MDDLEFHILAIDDDPLVLSEIELMYKEMLQFNDFDPIFGENSKGYITTVSNTIKGERVLQENFEKNPNLVQILHLDQRMPEETGSEFSDRMRWKYAGRKIGSLLVTGYSSDASVKNSREKGIFRFLSKPVTPEIILPHLGDLKNVIFSREKPTKKELDNPYLIKKIDTIEDFGQYLSLRFAVYDFMNYIPENITMKKSRLEADKFDFNAIPYGGFEIKNNKKTIYSTSRLITRTRQEPYATWLEEILSKNNEQEILKKINIKPEVGFPSEENYLLTEFYNKGPDVFNEFCEISRMTSHFDKRGLGLSREMIEIALGDAIQKGYKYAVGGNTPQHMPMYNLYGYEPINLKPEFINNKEGKIKDKNLLYFESVAQVAHIVIANFNKLPEPTNSNILKWKEIYNKSQNYKILK
jgi:CheY-like chemotaxis protein